ncbi:MAG: type II secretion system protein [Candidatus Gastranaerophilales bacterium]|nr:type II secretion system protein [Candidatus Gastranaerophilales bacterium]
MKNKFAFTLAEVMIVLAAIGVLSAVLIPTAMRSKPDENIMRFKNAHNAFYSVIRELVTSDKYFLDGDLGTKSDGTRLSSWVDIPAQRKYFCQTFGDVLNAKFVNCVEDEGKGGAVYLTDLAPSSFSSLYAKNGTKITEEILNSAKELLDSSCYKNIHGGANPKQFITQDGVWFYDLAPKQLYGGIVYSESLGLPAGEDLRVFAPPSQIIPTFHDDAGMDVVYKIFCMDIDGVPDNATKDDCVNECPFGYGVRADGKILNGARAEEWYERNIQGN